MKTATAVLAIVAAGTFAAAVTALPAHGVPADDPTDLIPGLLPDDQSATPPPADGTFRHRAVAGAGLHRRHDHARPGRRDDRRRRPDGYDVLLHGRPAPDHRDDPPEGEPGARQRPGRRTHGIGPADQVVGEQRRLGDHGSLPPAYAQTGQCEDNTANICYLAEQLFLDSKHLTRVATRDKVAPGTFYADYAANAIYLGNNPAGHAVEMSKTPTAIESGATGVTVRGLTIEHFATPPQGGAVVLGLGWKVVANDIRWNHAVGAMLVNADNAVLERNHIHSNGQLGVGQYSTKSASISANEVSYNNTDGFWIADWESGGIKTTWSSGGWVSGNLIQYNRGVGLWSDAYDDGRTFSRQPDRRQRGGRDPLRDRPQRRDRGQRDHAATASAPAAARGRRCGTAAGSTSTRRRTCRSATTWSRTT